MGPDKDLLIKYRDSLQVDNKSSIYLNALGKKRRKSFHLNDVICINPSFPKQFKHLLFSKNEFELEINPERIHNGTSEEKTKAIQSCFNNIEHTFYAQQDLHLEKGLKSFGFGFPIINFVDSSKNHITAPLFIWQLDINRSNKKVNTYIIRKRKEHDIQINPVLKSLIQQHYKIEINDNLQQLDETDLFDKEAIIYHLIDLAKQLAFNKVPILDNYFEELITSDNQVDIKQLKKPSSFDFLPIGLFGLYNTPKSGIIEDYNQMIKNWGKINNSPIKPIKKSLNNFSAVPINPSQEEIIHTLDEEGKVLIQGPPGTGKSHTLTAIISNAVLNGETCLIISEKHTALEVIQEQLNKIGIKDLSNMITNVHSDRFKVVDQLRKRIDFIENTPISPNKAEKPLTTINLNREIIKKHHQALQTTVIEDLNWQEALGEYLELEKAIKWNINLVLNSDWKILEHSLDNAIPHYSTSIEKDYLNMIYPKAFTNDNGEELYHTLKEHAFEHHNSCLEFAYDVERLQTWYKANKKEEIEDFINHTEDRIQEIQKYINSIRLEYPDIEEHLNASGIKKQIYSLKKIYKEEKRALEQLNKSIHELNLDTKHLLNLEHLNLDFNENIHLETIIEQLLNIMLDLPKVQEQLNEKIVIPFTFELILEGLKEEQIKSFNQLLLNFENHVLKNKFFSHQFKRENNLKTWMKNIHDLAKFFDDIYDDLDKEFLLFYRWKNHLSKENKKHQILLEILSQYPVEEWHKITRKKLLHEALSKHDSSTLLRNDSTHNRLPEIDNEYTELVKNQIHHYWWKRQLSAIQKFQNTHKHSVKSFFNYRKTKNNSKSSLRNILNKENMFMQQFCPILLTTPAVCSDLFSGQKNCFDIVVIDEASQIKTEHIYPTLFKAKKWVIAGDDQQLPPGEYFKANTTSRTHENDSDKTKAFLNLESLLEFAENNGIKKRRLNFHYRSENPQLIQYSNTHFYDNELISINHSSENAIDVKAINGSFINHINEKEVDAIIEILKETNEYQSIGIGCFNIHQRNAIIKAIQEEKEQNEFFKSKLDNMEKNGLFVKNIERIQGEERDLMIISFTYGVNEAKEFKEHFGPINTQKGYKMLNVLISRAKKRCILLHSIPQEKINQSKGILASNKYSGKGHLYHFIYCSTNNTSEVITSISHQEKPSNKLINQIGQSIEKQLNTKVNYNLNLNGLNGNIFFEYQDKKYVIDVDGVRFKPSKSAHNWDKHQQALFRKWGYEYHRIYSYDWWIKKGEVSINF